MEGYQLTFDDIERADLLASQPGRTAYIDESGNFGFNFSKDDVSTHYIVCAVVVKNEKIPELEQKVSELRQRYFGGSEMKSSSIANNHPRRAKILTELLLLDISLILLIADKQAFCEEWALTEYKPSFVKYLHQKLYDSMYATYPKLKIVEDEYGSSEFQRGYRAYIKEHRPEPNLFSEYDFDYIDSRNSNIVQIADIVAGSVMQHIVSPDAPDVLRIFSGRIRDIINFPKQFTSYVVENGADSVYDAQIYALADLCATSYIESNKASEEEEIRLRVLFLRQLIFNVRNGSESRFIYSTEITRHLSSMSEKHVTRDYLYRRIVAPLRDAGVLIASSTQGYKLPTCASDIYTYVNQTSGVVSPMLSRIGKCRDLVLKQSDGAFDILSDPTLEKYKRYFGDY